MRWRRRIRAFALASAALVLTGCSGCDSTRAKSEPQSVSDSAARAPTSATPRRRPASSAALHEPTPPPASERYPWLAAPAKGTPKPVTTLSARFPPPRGAKRGPLLPNGFGSWLRTLPLAADDTPVRTFRGDVLHAAGDPRVAAVVAIDVGRSDLQQCADAVIRLHAEWLWSRGRRSQSYTAASGTELPFTRYARGERVVNDGPRISWQARAAPASDHGAFRSYLDTVFAWANTVSLAKQAKVVPPAELRPGDFFVMGGNPGHSVLVLDLASDPHGKRFALLGQSFMPAQSFHVLRPAPEGVWFELDEARPIATPFWKPFEWKMLRRLDD